MCEKFTAQRASLCSTSLAGALAQQTRQRNRRRSDTNTTNTHNATTTTPCTPTQNARNARKQRRQQFAVAAAVTVFTVAWRYARLEESAVWRVERDDAVDLVTSIERRKVMRAD